MPSVSPVSAVPSFVTPAEHVGLTGSTPSSFDSIPPILRYKKEKVSAVFDPSLDWFQDTRGMLYVIESVLVFMSDDGHGFEIKYPAITLHAVSREQSGPCIYLQLNESEGAEDGEDDGMRELRLVPEGATDLDSIFEALCHCASLHPDNVDNDDDDDDAFIDADPAQFEAFTGEPGQELSEVGRAALEHLESIIEDPKGLIKANGVNGDREHRLE